MDGGTGCRDDARMETLEVTAMGAVFLLAGGVKGLTGMGLPTVAVSLLGLWMAPVEAAALLVAPSLATNIAQCRGPHARRLITVLWPAWLALAVVAVWAPRLDTSASALPAHRLLGAALVLYGVWGLWRPVLPVLPPRASLLGLVIGAVTGLVTAATAVFVLPLVPYLQVLRLDKAAMVQALGMSFTVATLALAIRVQSSGGLALLSPHAAVAFAAAFGGLWLGTLMRDRISLQVFQRSLFLVFIGLGAANWLRGA